MNQTLAAPPAKDRTTARQMGQKKPGSEWNDPDIPPGNAPLLPRWPLWLAAFAWAGWMVFMIVMMVVRLRTTAG